MGWPKLSSWRSGNAFLSPLITALDYIASAAFLAVLMLGFQFSRFFEELSGREQLPVDRTESEASARYGRPSVDHSLLSDETETPMEACDSIGTPIGSSYDILATDVRPTPPGQMLFCGRGPTPGTPAPAHPAAWTVPARRTSAPPSPSNIVPRNLEPVLLAAAATAAAAGANGSSQAACGDLASPTDVRVAGAFEPAVPTSTIAAEIPEDAISPATASTSPPASPPGLKAALRYSQQEADSLPNDSVMTIPRKAPGASSAGLSELHMLAPVRPPALEGMEPEHGAAVTGLLGAAGLGTAAASPAAVVASSSPHGPHGLNVHVVTESMGPGIAESDSWASPVEDAGGNGLRGTPGAIATKTAAGDLPAALAAGVPVDATDDVTPREAGPKARGEYGHPIGDDGVDETDAAGSELQEPATGIHDEGVTSSPSGPPEGGSPTGARIAEGLPDGLTASGADRVVAAAVAGAGQSTPHVNKQPQHGKAAAAGASVAKRLTTVTSTPSPRVVASSPKQKRGVTSPTGVTVAATPATARRPVNHEPVLRSPRAGGGDRPVARKLNPTSPKQDTLSGQVSPAAQSSFRSARSESGSVSAAAATATTGGVPRYLAPTAASMARTTQPPQQPPQRLSSTQKLLASTIQNVAVVDGVSAGAAAAAGGGAFIKSEGVSPRTP